MSSTVTSPAPPGGRSSVASPSTPASEAVSTDSSDSSDSDDSSTSDDSDNVQGTNGQWACLRSELRPPLLLGWLLLIAMPIVLYFCLVLLLLSTRFGFGVLSIYLRYTVMIFCDRGSLG